MNNIEIISTKPPWEERCSAAQQNPQQALLGLALIAAGLPLYFWQRKKIGAVNTAPF
jgi:hypothetical protein